MGRRPEEAAGQDKEEVSVLYGLRFAGFHVSRSFSVFHFCFADGGFSFFIFFSS